GLAFVITSIAISFSSHYASADDHLVEVFSSSIFDASYKERRQALGFIFGVNYEQVIPSKYFSPIQNTKSYSELFGDVPMNGFRIHGGLKLNALIGSIIGGVEYGRSDIDGYSTTTGSTTKIFEALTINKKGFFGRIQLDAMTSEPIIVPFVKAAYMTADMTARSSSDTTVLSLDSTTEISAGIMLQLNWIEPESSRIAYISNGLENSFLEIFYLNINHATPAVDEGKNKQDISSANSYGVGLVMEF
ncbi:MAG TPA: hypothetical protein PLU50_09770, partial [Pseudobdellovibrionaceae bacterium]|nr:hypothetical protein [Pseudobdellovibrionaceae bacterium]